MAIGDDAAAAGMDLVDGAVTPANTIDTEINKTRDYVVTHSIPTDGSITTAKLANDAVTAAKLATDSVTAAKIAAGAVGTSELAEGAVTYTRIGDDAVGYAKLTDEIQNRVQNGDFGSTDLETDGNGRFGDAWNNNITSTRRAVWMESDGTLGHTASARKFKQNIEPAELTEAQLRAIPIVLYRYRAAVASERNGGPRAAVEIGTLADDLHELGLYHFVVYEGRGDEAEPISVHYELLALAALALAQQLAERLDRIEARLAAIEAA